MWDVLCGFGERFPQAFGGLLHRCPRKVKLGKAHPLTPLLQNFSFRVQQRYGKERVRANMSLFTCAAAALYGAGAVSDAV